MKNKRGQIYLIAAVIIISIMVGFFSLGNYARKEKQSTRIYDMAKELKIETGSVYDFGIYNSSNLDNLTDNWTSRYYEYSRISGNIEDWIFVYGNKSDINAITFTIAEAGSVSINAGSDIEVPITKGKKEKNQMNVTGNNVKIKFKNFTHEFNLEEGENFYFVVKSKGYTARS